MNISGVIVYAAPKQQQNVEKQLNSIEGVEVHASQNNKLVVTVEHNNINALADQVMNFQSFDGVMSVAMVYQHNEDLELDKEDDLFSEEKLTSKINKCSDNVSKETQI